MRDEHGIHEEDELGNPRFESVREHSFQRQWRVFHAKQLCLAEEADAKIQTVKMYPTLTNVTLLRSWWLPGAAEGSVVQRKVLPVLGRFFAEYSGGDCYSGVCNANYKVRPDGRLALFEFNTRVGGDLAQDLDRSQAAAFFEEVRQRRPRRPPMWQQTM